MAIADDWRRAFARQAQSDLQVRDLLASQRRWPLCHELHYLQMACEKLVKAHLYTGKTQPANVRTTHVVLRKHLGEILQEHYKRLTGRNMPARLQQAAKQLAGEIEVLAPAADRDGRRPDNCEYPWDTPDGRVPYPAGSPIPVQ